MSSPPLAEDPTLSSEFSRQHDPVLETYDPFEGQEDDEQSELSFSSAYGTPTTNPHPFTHHHRETTV